MRQSALCFQMSTRFDSHYRHNENERARLETSGNGGKFGVIPEEVQGSIPVDQSKATTTAGSTTEGLLKADSQQTQGTDSFWPYPVIQPARTNTRCSRDGLRRRIECANDCDVRFERRAVWDGPPPGPLRLRHRQTHPARRLDVSASVSVPSKLQ